MALRATLLVYLMRRKIILYLALVFIIEVRVKKVFFSAKSPFLHIKNYIRADLLFCIVLIFSVTLYNIIIGAHTLDIIVPAS